MYGLRRGGDRKSENFKPSTEGLMSEDEIAKELEGTLHAVLLNNEMKQIRRLPVSELAEILQVIKDVAKAIKVPYNQVVNNWCAKSRKLSPKLRQLCRLRCIDR